MTSQTTWFTVIRKAAKRNSESKGEKSPVESKGKATLRCLKLKYFCLKAVILQNERLYQLNCTTDNKSAYRSPILQSTGQKEGPELARSLLKSVYKYFNKT